MVTSDGTTVNRKRFVWASAGRRFSKTCLLSSMHSLQTIECSKNGLSMQCIGFTYVCLMMSCIMMIATEKMACVVDPFLQGSR